MSGNGISGRITSVKDRWARLKARRPAARHIADAWSLLQRNNGNQYAAAITYFSFLALFPLLLLGLAVAGFVLHSHPAALQTLFDKITANFPGDFGATLKKAVNSAISARTGVGIIGLAGVLLTGLGWIGNLRSAIEAVWGRPPAKHNFVMAKVLNLFVLAGLGLGIVMSLGLTVVGTALTEQILRAADLDHVSGVDVLLKVLGVLLAVAGDLIIFWWLLVRLPGVAVPRRIVFKGALLAAAGFEVLKIVGAYTVAHTANSPTAGPFAGILAVLIWIQLVARYMLLCCAWTAVLSVEAASAATPAPHSTPSAAPPEQPAPPAGGPVASAATLVGAGAVAGAVVTWIATRPKPGDLDTGRES